MDRTYQLRLHRDDRVGASYQAQLYRVTDDGGLKLLADVSDDMSAGIQRVFELAVSELIDHRDEHGELP
jgi:hypothetical protein